MPTPSDVKQHIQSRYSEIATLPAANSCCGPVSSCCGTTYTIMSDDYTQVSGYVPDADLGLGCGLPTEHAGIEPGMTVLDLGSGAGNDVFVAASIVGSEGHVIGVDMTPAMHERATWNKEKLGLTQVEFRLGEIENLPVDPDSIDVVISNCVLNLVPDKRRAFSEIARVLRPGGHFCVSDIVVEGDMPPALRQEAELWAGCVAGAERKEDYLALLAEAGFSRITVAKEKEIVIPDSTLQALVTSVPEEERSMRGARLLSVTVTGWKDA